MYPKHFRNLVISAYNELKTVRKTASKFNISKSIVSHWLRNKELDKQPRKTFTRKVTQEMIDMINQKISKTPFITLLELAMEVKLKYKIIISKVTIRNILKKLGYANKRTISKVKIQNEDSLIKEYKTKINNSKREIVCLDETYFRYGMKPTRGWVLKNVKNIFHTNKITRKKVYNCLMVVSLNGIKYKLMKDSINSKILFDFINSHRKFFTNKTIVMDNVPFHKSKNIKDLVNQLNSTVEYIVPYHCELNPIEEVFSLLKHNVRKTMPITDSDYKDVISSTVNTITKDYIQKYYYHSFN